MTNFCRVIMFTILSKRGAIVVRVEMAAVYVDVLSWYHVKINGCHFDM